MMTLSGNVVLLKMIKNNTLSMTISNRKETRKFKKCENEFRKI